MDFGDVLLIVSLSFLKFSLTQFMIFSVSRFPGNNQRNLS